MYVTIRLFTAEPISLCYHSNPNYKFSYSPTQNTEQEHIHMGRCLFSIPQYLSGSTATLSTNGNISIKFRKHEMIFAVLNCNYFVKATDQLGESIRVSTTQILSISVTIVRKLQITLSKTLEEQ